MPVETGLQIVEVFDVTFSGFGGHPIKGWLILPCQRASKLSCIVKFIGYGGGRGFAHQHLLWPAAGYATTPVFDYDIDLILVLGPVVREG
jgi:cephalosporin-C deacetylase